MANIKDVTGITLSGINHIDALLDNGPGWVWLTPTRNIIYYTFSISSGIAVDNSKIMSSLTEFNKAQQSAAKNQLAYVSGLTGITFTFVTNGEEADLHFVNADLSSLGSGIPGLNQFVYGYGFNFIYDANGVMISGTDTITSFSVDDIIFLDSVEYKVSNENPTIGSWGYDYLLHELGHALGLKHPFDGTVKLPLAENITDNTVMSYTLTTPKSVFSPYDIAALNWLYGDDGIGGAYGVATSGEFIVGNFSPNKILGGAGNDKIQGDGGNDTIDGASGTDIVLFSGKLSNYILSKAGNTYTVQDKVGLDGTDTLTNIETLQFSDKTINLTVQAKAAAAPQANVTRLVELYVAFFNRVPDADGLSYWLDQMGAGKSVTQVADAFYNAGVQYSSLTGFSSSMSDADFVKVIYKNVLGRTGSTAPPDADVNYWVKNLTNGSDSRGSLINTILGAAHSYKGDTTWGWVSNLLDNKIAVAELFAIDYGLNYNTANDSITQGMAIAAAVTPTSTVAAIALIGVNATALHLG